MRTTGRSSLVRGITQRRRDTEASEHDLGSVGTVCIDEMDSALGIFQEEHEAMNSFFPDRAVRSCDILQLLARIDLLLKRIVTGIEPQP